MSADMDSHRPRRRRWPSRLQFVATGIVFAAAGLALLSVLLVGAMSETPAPSMAGPTTAPRMVAEPDHIFDRYVASRSSPTPAPPIEPPLGDAPYQLLIPRISVDATVNTYGLDAAAAPEVPLNGQEVAWYDWSARPGTGSNAVLAGHVTWSGSAVFYNLEQLSDGDEIVLRAGDGAELSYTVEDNFLVDPDDPASLSVMGPTDEDVITVITCGGAYFPTGGAFGGDYAERRVVRASLSQVTPAPDAAVEAH